MLLNPFPSSLLICRSVFSSLVTTANQEKKVLNFLHYNSTFSRGYWCASKLRRYAAPQKEYFIDYVSTVQMFSTWFARRNSFNHVNISGRSLTSMCGSFTSFYRKAGSQLQKSCRSSNRWQTVDSAEKFPSVATEQCSQSICRGSPVNPLFSLEPLRIFLEGWHCEVATAESGCHCSLWCWVPGCLLRWLCPGTDYCSHAAELISGRQQEMSCTKSPGRIKRF